MTGDTGGRVSVDADVVVGGPAQGRLLVLTEPVSFWGGVDPADGRIVDRNHPQVGVSLAGCALLTGASRGSSSSSSTLLECVRRGTAPALLLATARDPILVVAAAVAREIYGRGPALAVVDPVDPPHQETDAVLTSEGELYLRAAG